MRPWGIRGGGTLFAALLGTMACGDVVGPGPEVELEVTLSEALAVPGENLTISIVVFNPGDHDISLGDRCPPLGFRVIDEDGHRVGPAFNWERSFVCLGEVINTVPAGESIVYTFLWSPFFQYGGSDGPLPAGGYEIYAGFAGEPLRPPFSDRVAIEVATASQP